MTSAATAPQPGADTIYFGGPIITINQASPSAEAVAIKDGKIVAVGARASVFAAEKGSATTLYDLKGRTLIPGFVDAHSHFTDVSLQAVTANLLSPPDGPVKTIPDMQAVLRGFISTSPMVKAHGVVIGMNLDDSQLEERRFPTRHDLDAVSTELPIFVTHQSGHLAVLNSRALAMVGITADTPSPAGGAIEREADGRTPDGVLKETAFFAIMPKMVPAFTPGEYRQNIEAAQRIYIENGFTTVQDGKTSAANVAALPVLNAEGVLKIDIVAYPDLVAVGDAPVLDGPLMSREYTGHLRIGGVKVTLDGSPQGKTAWFTEPYFKAPDGEEVDYAGLPAFTDETLQPLVDMAYTNHWQLLAHINGDAAIDQLIRVVSKAQSCHGYPDSRTVMVHGQFLRADQIPALKTLGIFPALFPMHTFYWGDWHRQSVAGPERAENISPTGWVLQSGLMTSIHSDAPVVFPNSMVLISTAVNRTTRSGYVLGPAQRLTPLQALYAMTLWPAYQHFEEGSKGSIEVGKRADLLILSANPLTAPVRTLDQIKVDETIKDGISIYQRERAP
ncbi:amidohydrolase [Brevundimonas goettingensis]|uniref:Amidohydrolase n=1 Tax=Brevundimonas goettingensis TaxID=2774190 RepID=A0A975C3J4_9CAUL|nr:amidohydrolase [Brevundimonas goettingensis]QTC93198.1 amidohydrolase [Brevundimonas goettingensis]